MALLSEIDHRKLFVPEGYASMFHFCVGHLHLFGVCGLQASASAQRGWFAGFPWPFERLARGGIHLTGLNMISPHLTTENQVALLACGKHQSKPQMEVF